jgi:hypothetical protein
VAKANRGKKQNYIGTEAAIFSNVNLSSVNLWSVNGNRNRRHSKIRRALVQMKMRPKCRFRCRSAR